jgi:uncharacterized SAM-binding protein YcdF (DUF218 family)
METKRRRKLAARPPRGPVVRTAAPRGRQRLGWLLLRWVLALVLLVALVWTLWVVHRIDQVAREDQAEPADAIAVFGAAEYNGRPSPIYHARLDQAVSLYNRQIAPVIVTLGGAGDRNSGQSEGGVGRDYLLARGVPLSAIIAETRSIDTEQQAHWLAETARERGFTRIVVVSDPTHLFRIRALCEADGLDVYTSPRRSIGHISTWDLTMRYVHEVISYTAMRLHVNTTALHRWTDGKSDD